MARSKITKRIRLFVWLVIAIITAPFACANFFVSIVVQASFWLLDLVAGDQFPRLRIPTFTMESSKEGEEG